MACAATFQVALVPATSSAARACVQPSVHSPPVNPRSTSDSRRYTRPEAPATPPPSLSARMPDGHGAMASLKSDELVVDCANKRFSGSEPAAQIACARTNQVPPLENAVCAAVALA